MVDEDAELREGVANVFEGFFRIDGKGVDVDSGGEVGEVGCAGKGGFTIFAQIIGVNYRWRNFMGLPWCATFLHAVFIEALGKKEARELLGKPHPGTRVLWRRMKRKNRLTDEPSAGCVVFLTNDRKVDHCGIVISVNNDTITTVEGNTTDLSGVFEKHEGGAVAQRVRKLTDPAIICYGR